MKIIEHKCKECMYFSDEYDKYVCYKDKLPTLLVSEDGGCMELVAMGSYKEQLLERAKIEGIEL